ncbi:hypothetical protein COCNU_11G007460 [Cocos nucifera]|uniref:Uncharacterized protein n=1 Tax=Cocos nucifera TaxID=13894 RepID=A0A8K0N9E8_COCNU|nr:hypothetical protein COCNU_11G007460 [Cocos nucifera]
MVGGSSRAANDLRKEKSAPTKAVMSIQSTAPAKSIPRPFASSSKRSLGGLKISIRMSDHRLDILESVSLMEVSLDIEDKRKDVGNYRIVRFLLKLIILPTDVLTFEEAGGVFRIQNSYDSLLRILIREVRRLSKEAEEKATQTNRRTDDAQLSRLKDEDETRSLRERMKQLESELAKTEARVPRERKVGRARAEGARIEAVEAFHTSKEFHNIKMDFASLSYLQGGIDLKEKVRRIFPNLNLDLLESDDEEAKKVESRKVQMKDVLSPARDDPTVEDVASVLPPVIITLLDQAEIDESRAPDKA